MATPGTPTSFELQQANRQVFLSWSIAAGATSYDVQRSTDGVTYSIVSSPATNNYLDTTVTVGTLYYYQIRATGSSGSSPYTAPQQVVPTPNGEMSLGEIRLRAQQRADRVNSPFVSNTEWNSYINQSLYELYDLLTTVYEDYFVAPEAFFQSVSGTATYPLPDGAVQFNDATGTPFTAQPFYKLLGVDLGLQSANNAFVSVKKFNFADRNKYVYSNTSSTIYGVFNLQYRVMGNNLLLIPAPSGNQPIGIWYIPRMPMLLKDTDYTITGISGWIEYVITDAAIKALQKEESDVSVLAAQKMALIKRIEETAINRDAGQPDTISDVRMGGNFGGGYGNGGFSGPTGGW